MKYGSLSGIGRKRGFDLFPDKGGCIRDICGVRMAFGDTADELPGAIGIKALTLKTACDAAAAVF